MSELLLNHSSGLEWLDAALSGLQAGGNRVLATIVQAQGSTPRDAGARLCVGQQHVVDTIGGGNLELQAIELARRMLSPENEKRRVVRFALGPSLGQCCGGVVWLLFERLDSTDLPWLEEARARLAASEPFIRRVALPDPAPLPPNDESAVWLDRIMPPALNVVVCGAGHVGKAIIRLLGDLPVQVVWLDPRNDQWPARIPSNVRCIEGDASDVLDCPNDAYWLILTHSHALDLDIIEQVFRHKSFQFMGLIGSKTKRARFRARLQQHFPDMLVDRMQCPIGLVSTSSKLPSVIAISVVAQLLPWLDAGSGQH